MVLLAPSCRRAHAGTRSPRARLATALLWACAAGWCALCASNCQLERPTALATASALPSAPRLPDAVAVDPLDSLPAATNRGQTRARLISLREPADASGAMQTIRAFFSAASREDPRALRAVLSSDASLTSSASSSGPPAEAQWDRRFSKLDYRAIGPAAIYRESAVEVYRYEDLDAPVGDRPSRPAMMMPDDIAIRVPIDVRKAGADRLFGDEILFVLRRIDGAFRIRAMIEDFQPP